MQIHAALDISVAVAAAEFCRKSCTSLLPNICLSSPAMEGSGANMCEGAQQGQWRSKDYAASTAFQIAGTVWFLIRRLPRANCPLRIRWSSSIPAMVVAAQSKFLKPSIGPVRDLIPGDPVRSDCSGISTIATWYASKHRLPLAFRAPLGAMQRSHLISDGPPHVF